MKSQIASTSFDLVLPSVHLRTIVSEYIRCWRSQAHRPVLAAAGPHFAPRPGSASRTLVALRHADPVLLN
ncbi:hypothetical protein EVAR_83184_1 [Eumeta japonica]|uniref:Uncharacterized protein n=1 Tax=Eumeta variegata TaxID=151549 RepID=A0A4C2A4N7_EUMVA|nr:hypothetical protein EVAR_83184_1 [Eumeta japonica]